MGGLFWGVVAGFLIGSFGYIFTYFIISPVFRYRKIKRNLAAELRIVEKSAAKDSLSQKDIMHIDGLRFHAKALTQDVELRMPLWFRLSLERQNENPLLAASELMTLANVRIPDHLEKRIATVRGHLRLIKPGAS
ncbi:hypothetical protein [Desulfobotulus sp.]|jgi:hypothetical protein|uniref:hypothetical protein n=1 Tax=Desulfobotulus sp. TaxID=1940337 RepID=UPI002A36FE5B|nr:hypothetical protein [Desulfobotulus sp.]MDY0163730.1 hypothetical protein [Desulfobotulus sp.]